MASSKMVYSGSLRWLERTEQAPSADVAQCSAMLAIIFLSTKVEKTIGINQKLQRLA